MLRYNLKKILIEEDELDLVDTSFMDKWDKVPEWTDPDGVPGPEWEEYMNDLRSHIKSRLTDYVKNNPDVTLEYLKRTGGSYGMYLQQFQKPKIKYQVEPGDQMVEHYISAWEYDDDLGVDHIENSRADTWIEDFHRWLESM